MKNTRFITGDERLRIQKTLEGPMGISLKKGGGHRVFTTDSRKYHYQLQIQILTFVSLGVYMQTYGTKINQKR